MTAIREIRVKSLKALADVRLELGGLTVLVGSNGTGKSTLLEALELFRVCAHATEPAEHLGKFHGGMHALARQGENTFILESTIAGEDPEQTLHYQMKVHGNPIRIEESATTSDNKPLDPFDIFSEFTLHELRQKSGARGRPLYDQLANIDVHLPFDVGAGWATLRHRQGEAAARKPNIIDSTRRLERFGANLASAYHTLKNELGAAHWRETFELVQLGLGRDVIDVSSSAFGGGHVSLSVEFASIGRVPAFALADGVLTYLAFVALTRLDEGRSLLAFDEPETHLHPALLARVVGFFEDAATRYPVVLATHSDRLLDCLSDPVASVVVCELDEQHRVVLRRLDPTQYDKWREDYRGVGDIRAEGQLESILAES